MWPWSRITSLEKENAALRRQNAALKAMLKMKMATLAKLKGAREGES